MRIALREDERNALDQLSKAERRDPRAQAALLIRSELERRGLLPVNTDAMQRDAARGAMQQTGVMQNAIA